MHPDETDYNYEDTINELSDNNIDVGNAYIYTDHPLNAKFDAYFQFCQKNLTAMTSIEGINIEPSRFYFVDNNTINAKAYPRTNGYFRIYVEKKTVEEIYNLFCVYNYALDDPELSEYKNLSDFFERSSYQQSLDYIVFQHSVLYIYFHELGHLIQYSNYESLNKGNEANKVLNINDEAHENKKFDIKDHVLEIDADRISADFLGKSVLDTWSNLPLSEKTEGNLRKLIVVSLVGVLSFFIMVKKFPITGIYYDKTTHPHPLIRLSWISYILVNTAKNYYPNLDSQDINSETLRVLNVYSRYKHLDDIYENNFDPYVEHGKDMSDYLYSLVETARTPGYEYLSK